MDQMRIQTICRKLAAVALDRVHSLEPKSHEVDRSILILKRRLAKKTSKLEKVKGQKRQRAIQLKAVASAGDGTSPAVCMTAFSP